MCTQSVVKCVVKGESACVRVSACICARVTIYLHVFLTIVYRTCRHKEKTEFFIVCLYIYISVCVVESASARGNERVCACVSTCVCVFRINGNLREDIYLVQ